MSPDRKALTSSVKEQEFSTKRIVSRHPESPQPRYITITDHAELKPYFMDTLKMPLGGTRGVVRFSQDSTVEDIAAVVGKATEIIPVGAQSAVTGAATPDRQDVLDMSRRNRILAWEDRDTVTVQTGITAKELRDALTEKGLYYPPAPTFDGATIGGNIGTNAAGAATFKYGQTRDWIEAITVALPNGEILDIERGEYKARNGQFEWEDADGNIHKIPAPTYKMPDVPKVSAGYYSHPDMDLIDLFIGSEGTLGVVTEARLRVIEKPPTTYALISCNGADQAFGLLEKLRDASEETTRTKNSDGLDISAIEYLDGPSVTLLREDSIGRAEIKPPDDANTLLIVQMETNNDRSIQDIQLDSFGAILDELEIDYSSVEIAEPTDQPRIEYYRAMREAVPDGVNQRIANLQHEETERTGKQSLIRKTAADMIVPVESFADMMKLIAEKSSGEELDIYTWGHAAGGGININVVPRTSEQATFARKLVVDCCEKVIEWGGSPFAEHGVGKDPDRQALVQKLYGEEGINQMRQIKKAFDSTGKLSPGNIFALAA